MQYFFILMPLYAMTAFLYVIADKEKVSNKVNLIKILFIYTFIGFLISYPHFLHGGIFWIIFSIIPYPFFAFFTISDVKNGKYLGKKID